MASQNPLASKLLGNDRIADWRVIFEASTEHLRSAENGERHVLQMLPAYVNRSVADQVLVQDVIKSVETVKAALDILSETLDPPSDQYSAMQALSRITWHPGERIEDFFFSIKRKAVEAKVDMRFVAPLIAAQLLRAVESKIKSTVADIDPGLDGKGGRDFLISVKKDLMEKGYALDCGNRDFERIERVANIHGETSTDANSTKDPIDCAEGTNKVA